MKEESGSLQVRRGIGAGIAKGFAAAGADFAVAEITTKSGKAIAVQGDARERFSEFRDIHDKFD